MEEILNMYQKSLKKDLSFGKTSLGVHTDDMTFLLDDYDLREYGSEGQQKNAIISMKFAELELFKEKKGYYPILILDDLFSELDEVKINNILDFISDDIQTFVTTTELDKVSLKLKENSKIFSVFEGTVKEEKYAK